MVEGIVVKERDVRLFEFEKKSITNVSSKNTPYEMSDSVIATNMARFGEVINGSVGQSKGRLSKHASRISKY